MCELVVNHNESAEADYFCVECERFVDEPCEDEEEEDYG